MRRRRRDDIRWALADLQRRVIEPAGYCGSRGSGCGSGPAGQMDPAFAAQETDWAAAVAQERRSGGT